MNKFVLIFSIAVIIGVAKGQSEYGNLVASNIGAFNLQVYDSGKHKACINMFGN
jgi:hypothetical protein